MTMDEIDELIDAVEAITMSNYRASEDTITVTMPVYMWERLLFAWLAASKYSNRKDSDNGQKERSHK